MAEAHGIGFAPHSGSLGPVAAFACLHLLATLPNTLIMEHLEDDVPQRYEVVTPLPEVVDGHIVVPNTPGLGVEIVEEAIAHYPASGNISAPQMEELSYVQARRKRAGWIREI
jgi:galactonate dehydratase